VIILVLVRRKSIHYDEDMCENRFCIFVSSDLDLSILDLNFAPFVTVVLVQGHVSKKMRNFYGFPVSRKVVARGRQMDRHTDEAQRLIQPPYVGQTSMPTKRYHMFS